MITSLFQFNGDGWWPRVSPDAKRVCFGNKESRAFDIETGKLWNPFPARQSRWIAEGIVTCTVEIDTTHAKRFTRDGVVITDEEDNTSLVAGNDFDADQGHWVSCIAAGRLVIDGRVFLGSYRNAQMKWPWVVASLDDIELAWFFAGEMHARAPLPARANALRLQSDGSVRTGYFWDVQTISPHTPVVDATVTPWRRESPHVVCNGVTWTSTETPDGRLGVLGVFAPDQAVILENWGCSWLDVGFNGQSFIVAGCDDKGQLRIYQVDKNTSRKSIAAWGQKALTYPKKPSDIPAMGAPKYFGAWFTDGRYGVFNLPGNSGILGGGLYEDGDGRIPDNAYEMIRNRSKQYARLFIGADEKTLEAVRPNWDRVVAVFHHEVGNGSQTLKATKDAKALVARLKLSERPVMSCLRPEDTIDTQYRNTADITGCEIYFDKPAATLAEMETLVNQRLDTVLKTHTGSVILFPQQFDRSLDPDWQAQPAMMEVIIFECVKRMAVTPRILGCLSFAVGRKGGIDSYPQLLMWHQEIAKRIEIPAKKEEHKVPTEIRTPSQAQAIDALRRIDDRYRNVLKRPHGMFGVPPDGKDVSIKDPSRPDVEFDTKGLAVWGMSVYIGYYVRSTAGDPHEDAIRKTLAEIDNSAEAKAQNPQ
jgi:hypothetical protein